MFVRFLFILLFSSTVNNVAAAPPEQPTELRDLHYGEVLYQLYQQNYFDAIVHLLSAQQQGYMQVYGEEPDLLLGGLYLTYGMPDTAETLFQRVLKENASPQIHDQAWLQLAKTRHRREQQTAATTALNKIGAALPESQLDERQVLESLIQLEQGENQQAQQVLSQLTGKSDWSIYGHYNKAIALLRTQQTEAGLEILEEIGTEDAESPEQKALKDRANLIRGYLLLEAKKPAQASKALEQIRLSSLVTNQALLGVGWAALMQDQPEKALAPWLELARRDARDIAVLEVILAIPYAYALLEAEEQSLDNYQQGIGRYEQEIQRLDQAIDAINQGQLLITLQSRIDIQQKNPDQLISLLPLLLAENKFQERLQDYRDLLFLQTNLREWSDKISDYQTMLEVRQAAYDKQSPIVQAKLSGDELSALQAERDRLYELYQLAISPHEPLFMLVNTQEKQLLDRFEKIESLITILEAHKDLSDQKKTAQLLRGLLIWRTVTEHPARSWEASKQLKTLDQSMEQTRQQQAALQQAHQITQGGFGRFNSRIHSLERQIPGLLTQVSQAQTNQAKILQQMAVNVLEERKILINNYLIQARFGIASLLDSKSPDQGEME